MSKKEILDLLQVNAVVFAWVLVLYAFATAAELIIDKSVDKSYKNTLTNIGLLIVNSLGFAAIIPLFGLVFLFLEQHGMRGLLFQEIKATNPFILAAAFMFYLFVYDFFQYWGHRLQHIVPWLWKFHRVHHSDTAINASTEFRRSLGEIVTLYMMTAIPTGILFGPKYLSLVLLPDLIFSKIWGYVNHVNLKMSFGPLTPVISGPHFHRMHHGIDHEFHHCNFSAVFPVIDLMFGTYRHPGKNEYPQVGVGDGIVDKNVVQQALLPMLSSKPTASE